MPKALMTPDLCANALVDVMLTIDGMGLVYPQRHVVRTEDDVQKWLFVEAQTRANGWFVTLAPAAPAVTTRGMGHNAIGMKGGGHNDMTVLKFSIEGYYSILDEDGSELTFRNLAFAVVNEINSYGLLGIADTVDIVEQSPADIDLLGYAVFANTHPMHYCNISVAFRGRCH